MTAAPASHQHKKHGYSSLQIALHWTIVVLVAFQWFLGWGPMSEAYDAVERDEVPATLGGAYVHIAIGVVILIAMVVRLTVKLRRPVQVAPDSDHPILRTLGSINHWIFYVLLIALPLGGLLAWFGRNEVAANLHALLALALPFFIAVHVLAALFHHFVLRDGLIRRMVRPTGGT